MKAGAFLFFTVLFLAYLYTRAEAQDRLDFKQQYKKGTALYNKKICQVIAQHEELLPGVESSFHLYIKVNLFYKSVVNFNNEK